LKKLGIFLILRTMFMGTKVTGTVIRYFRTRGCGFIKPQEGGEKVFVHWEDLVTDDDWPFVKKGTKVEYLVVDKDGKPTAKDVTLLGGEKIPIFTKPLKNVEINEEDTFTGSVKFYDFRKGFGYVKPDGKIIWKGESSAGWGLHFTRDTIRTIDAGKGMVLRVPTGLRVSFKVYKSAKGLCACEVQNENKTPIKFVPWIEVGNRKRKRQDKLMSNEPAKTKGELIEEREIDFDEKTYMGTVMSYKPEKEFGFINISQEIWFKNASVKQRIFVRKEDIVCYSDEIGLTEGCAVKFKIYKDSKGLGACEVMNADGTPIEYLPENKGKKKTVKRRKRN